MATATTGTRGVPTADEVQAVIAACSPTTRTGLRNRALIMAMWRAGLRPGEALGALVPDVHLDEGWMLVQRDSGAREVALDRPCRAAMRRWLEARADMVPGDPDGVLFCTGAGKPLHASYVRDLLARLAARAGVGNRVHALGLRYSLARDLAAEGVSTEVIEAQLGVGRPEGVGRFLPVPGREELVRTIGARR